MSQPFLSTQAIIILSFLGALILALIITLCVCLRRQAQNPQSGHRSSLTPIADNPTLTNIQPQSQQNLKPLQQKSHQISTTLTPQNHINMPSQIVPHPLDYTKSITVPYGVYKPNPFPRQNSRPNIIQPDLYAPLPESVKSQSNQTQFKQKEKEKGDKAEEGDKQKGLDNTPKISVYIPPKRYYDNGNKK